jgi:DNA-binding MarR family transcriptional regulator
MSDPLGFLLSDAARLLRRRFDQHARALGVTRPQWQVLFALSRNEGTNQGALADHLEVEAITLCRMIDRLEEGGLVERRADPADRRAWRLHLTDKARPLLDQMRIVGSRVLDEALTGLDAGAVDDLAASLERIRTNLSQKTAVDSDVASTGAKR